MPDTAYIKGRIKDLIAGQALGTLGLRAGIVGANFAVMFGLTATLGFTAFGALMHLWSMAMVASAVISFGGPNALLRGMSRGSGVGRLQALGVIFAPAGLAILGMLALRDAHWQGLLAAAFMINLLSCLASIMRSFGSVQVSMILRDAGPFVALGMAVALGARDGDTIIWVAVVIMGVVATLAALWCVRQRNEIAKRGAPEGLFSAALWGNSVLGMLVAQIDLIIGGLFMGQAELGVYAFLRRIANLVALPVTVATWVSGKPIATAFYKNDSSALQLASAQGSRIAWYPALALCGLCMAVLVISFWVPSAGITPAISITFAVLLLCALTQAYFASATTVAILSDFAYLAVLGRALTVMTYGIAVVICAPALNPVLNAVCYTAAATLGSLVIWAILWRTLGIDTSARALTQKGALRWKAS